MKTLNDIFALIIEQTELNKNKMLKYTYSVDTRYFTISANILTFDEQEKKDVIFKEIMSHKSIATPEQIQEVYWTLYNNGRKNK